MTSANLILEIRSKALEVGVEIISDAKILTGLNFAYEDVCKRIFPASQILSATVAFTAGVGTFPATFGTLYGDALDANNNRFPELSIDDFNKKIVEQGITVEGGTLKVLPTTTTSLVVKYWPTFPELTASVNPTINSYFHKPLIYGGLSYILEDLQDAESSVFYGNKYEEELNKRIAMQSQFDEENQRSSTMFDYQTLI